MKSLKEMIEMGKKNGAINAGRDYLINNPAEFFELLKQDILLAEQYINFFDQSSVVSIIRHVQKKNENLFENLMKLSKTPDKIVISTPFVKITAQNVKQHFQIDFEVVPAFEAPPAYNPNATMLSYRNLINQLNTSSDVQVTSSLCNIKHY